MAAPWAMTQALAGGAHIDPDVNVKDYLTKIRNFDEHFVDDIVLKGAELKVLKSVTARLRRIQSTVGYANFGLLSFDQALYYAGRFSAIGEFTHAEKEFLERVFYTNSRDYGFYGEKVLDRLTAGYSERETAKIPYTGHFLLKGAPLNLYKKIQTQVGSSIVLTSGVRGIVKQMYLFLNKASENRGNLSLASRSLAPPGHSFHGVGDFDVGKTGLGALNFTEHFARTSEFRRLTDLGYIQIRYTESNPFGVRYEPWHIKVV